MTIKKITRLLSASVVCALLSMSSACGGGGAVADAQKLADEACACKDAACIDKVKEKSDKFMDKYSQDDIKKLSDEDMEKFMASAIRASKCEATIKGAGK